MGAIGHGFAQPLENLADVNGADDALDAGAARARQGGFRWNEEGAYAVLGFFQQLESSVTPGQQISWRSWAITRAAGQRLVIVQGAVGVWHFQHPG